MATKSRRSDPGLIDDLFEEPWKFRFFEAVRLLRLAAAHGNYRLDAGNRERAEPIRFKTWLGLDFPASEINALEPSKQGGDLLPCEMTVSFMGLTGPSGVLPRHYTEMLMERRTVYKDVTAHVFFDVFNNRLLQLFYRAWEKYHFFVPYERGEHNGFTRNVLDLVGMGAKGLQGRLQENGQGVDDRTLVYYSGLLAQRPHSVAGLEAMFTDYFGVPVSVEQFRGRWLSVPDSECTRIGGRNSALGTTLMLGGRVWDMQSLCRIRIGPLNRKMFDAFLPDGNAYLALHKLARFYLGASLDFQVQLVLKKEEVPAAQLGGGKVPATRLGWDTWLKNRPFTRDAEDSVFPARE